MHFTDTDAYYVHTYISFACLRRKSKLFQQYCGLTSYWYLALNKIKVIIWSVIQSVLSILKYRVLNEGICIGCMDKLIAHHQS